MPCGWCDWRVALVELSHGPSSAHSVLQTSFSLLPFKIVDCVALEWKVRGSILDVSFLVRRIAEV